MIEHVWVRYDAPGYGPLVPGQDCAQDYCTVTTEVKIHGEPRKLYSARYVELFNMGNHNWVQPIMTQIARDLEIAIAKEGL